MKKILVLVMAVAMLITMLALVACGDDTPDTTDPVTTTETKSDDPADTTVKDDDPVVTTPKVTTAPETTVPAGPNMKNPAEVYHVEQIVVKTNSDGEDSDYLVLEDAGENYNERYADGNGYILYSFDLTEWIEPTIDFTVRQQYAIYVTDDIDVVDYNDMICLATFADIADQYPHNDQGAYDGGANQTTITLKPYEHNFYGKIYVYIVNSNPPTGWGGTISQFTINHYVKGEGADITTIDNSPSGEKWAPPGATEEQIVVQTNKNKEDADYIVTNTGAITDDSRYFDDNKFIVYRIEVRKFYQPTIELSINQNYKIEVSPDGENWIEIANFATSEFYLGKLNDPNTDPADFHSSGDYLPARDAETLVINPYQPAENADPITGNLYIRISDCFPTAGWGGKIHSFTIKHYGLVDAE